jgi:hypothetical protein
VLLQHSYFFLVTKRYGVVEMARRTNSAGRQNQSVGKWGEERAILALQEFGVQMVESIASPVALSPDRKVNGRQSFFVAWKGVVSGDTNGIWRGGRRVLTETKTVLEGNLVYSKLREHQPERLSENARLGGISLLVWVNENGVYIMDWSENGIEGFGEHKSITIERAIILSSATYEKYHPVGDVKLLDRH